MTRFYTTLSVTAAICGMVTFGVRADDSSQAVQDTKDSNAGAWQNTKDAAHSAGETVENGAEAVGGAVKHGANAAGHAVKKGANAAGHAVKKGAEAVGSATKKAARKGAQAVGLSKSERDQYAAYERNEIGEHRMTGRVTSIDHQTGHLVVDSHGTPLNLHFPRATLSNIKTGQTVTVQMAFAKIPVPAEDKTAAQRTGVRAYDAPGFEKTDHWMTGTVDSVDHERGLVQLTAEEGTQLKLQFPAADIQDLKQGDRIAVELALIKNPRKQ